LGNSGYNQNQLSDFVRTVIINPKWLLDFENCGYVLEPGYMYLISSELLWRTAFRTSSYQLPISITALYW
jgi:hypothetical protein